jgi:biotin--protein ligase
VYLQYIFGLSVVEAVRSLPGYEDLELRLKWPNDIYADLGGTQGLKKIGGILVNSMYAGKDFTVIVGKSRFRLRCKSKLISSIGCGINTTNSSPTTSLLDLIQSHNHRTNAQLAIISQEQLLANILPRFEYFWSHFEQEGSFQSLAPLYTRRWLHTDREVTIRETGQRVRIVGLTPEYGLLRTVSLDSPTRNPHYIDLEPDGNSFDMMQGLLKAKK